MSRRFAGRPPPLSTHPSGKYWGKPPALTPPGHKGKGKASDKAFPAPEESICDTIDHSNLRGILRDLCYWQSHVTTVEELTGKVTSADWYPLLLDKLAESVIVISGAPNVGKSSLAVHLAKTLGLTRTKTTSRNFWLFARNKRPYFSLWIYCTDSFWNEDEPAWHRMGQSVLSVTSNEEFSTGAVILEGHRIFAFPGYFLVRIHRSGESGLIQEFLFVLRYEPTIHGTSSRFHNLLANFWLSLTYTILSGRDNHRVSLRQLQTSKQDNHGVQRKFAFNRQFVRGSVGTPEGISSISGNHWIQCRAPFILDLGS